MEKNRENQLDLKPFLPFYKSLEELKTSYEKLEEQNRQLAKQVEEWNKDEEIQKLKQELKNGYHIPASVMKKMRQVAKVHKAETKHDNCVYVITETELDNYIECRCEDCWEVLLCEWI